MVFLSSRISPRTSTVIFLDRSPVATAVVTAAIFRTWAVKFDAIEFTLSVRSFHVPPTPRTCAWPPSFRSDLARHTGNFGSERVQLVHHRVDGVLQFENFSFHVYRDLL